MNGDDVFVFVVSRNTRPPRTRVLWRMARDEAKQICSDPRTAHRSHMLCWTAGPGTLGEDWTWVKDSGAYDGLLRELGIAPTREGDCV